MARVFCNCIWLYPVLFLYTNFFFNFVGSDIEYGTLLIAAKIVYKQSDHSNGREAIVVAGDTGFLTRDQKISEEDFSKGISTVGEEKIEFLLKHAKRRIGPDLKKVIDLGYPPSRGILGFGGDREIQHLFETSIRGELTTHEVGKAEDAESKVMAKVFQIPARQSGIVLHAQIDPWNGKRTIHLHKINHVLSDFLRKLRRGVTTTKLLEHVNVVAVGLGENEKCVLEWMNSNFGGNKEKSMTKDQLSAIFNQLSNCLMETKYSNLLGPTFKVIRLPTELWVDTFKLLSRRCLAHHVQLSCKHFHTIVQQHVQNVHLASHFGQFLRKLECNLPTELKLFGELLAEKSNTHRYFRPSGNIRLYLRPLQHQRSRPALLAILSNFPELYHGCQCYLAYPEETDEFIANLDLLQSIRPFCIKIGKQFGCGSSDNLLRRLTVLRCPRVNFFQWWWADESNPEAVHWLHHFSADEEITTTRILSMVILTCKIPIYMMMVVEHCKQILMRAKKMADRRAFAFMIVINSNSDQTQQQVQQLPLFRLQNVHTGELLQLERHEIGQHVIYLLRRCLLADLASVISADQFFRDTFSEEDWSFRTPNALTLTFC